MGKGNMKMGVEEIGKGNMGHGDKGGKYEEGEHGNEVGEMGNENMRWGAWE
jgi:hypothetical protein